MEEGSYLPDSDGYSDKSSYSISAMASHKRGMLEYSSQESIEGQGIDTAKDSSPIPFELTTDEKARRRSNSVSSEPAHPSRSRSRDRTSKISRSHSRTSVSSERRRNLTDHVLRDMDFTSIPNFSKASTGTRPTELTEQTVAQDLTKRKWLPKYFDDNILDSHVDSDRLSVKSDKISGHPPYNPDPTSYQLDLMTEHIQKLNADLEKKDQDTIKYTIHLEKMQSQYNENEIRYLKTVSELRKENDKCRQEIHNMKSKCDKLVQIREQMDKLKEEKASTDYRAAEMFSRLDEKEVVIKTLKEKNRELSELYESLFQAHYVDKKNLEGLQSKLDTLRQESRSREDKLIDELSQLKTKIDNSALEIQLTESLRTEAQLKGVIESNKEQIDRQKKEMEELREKFKKMKVTSLHR